MDRRPEALKASPSVSAKAGEPMPIELPGLPVADVFAYRNELIG
jgi:hypothetical protein